MGAGSKLCASEQRNHLLLLAMLSQSMGMSLYRNMDQSAGPQWLAPAAAGLCHFSPEQGNDSSLQHLLPLKVCLSSIPLRREVCHYWAFLWQVGHFFATEEVLEKEQLTWIP